MECMAGCPTLEEKTMCEIYQRVNAQEWSARMPPIPYEEADTRSYHTYEKKDLPRFLEEDQVRRVRYREAIQTFRNQAKSRQRQHSLTALPLYVEATVVEQSIDVVALVGSHHCAALALCGLNARSSGRLWLGTNWG